MKKYSVQILLFMLFVGFGSFAGAQTKVIQDVDVLPSPVGGINAIAENVTYPEEAKKNKIEGNAENIKILNSIGYGCDEAAVTAVENTKFNPGILHGKPVAAQITIPVKFKLK